MDRYEREVQAGIALLDEKGPADWRSRIDTATLDLYSLDECVLGQVYGEFGEGARALGIWDDVAAQYAHGFDVADRVHFPPLNVAWLKALGS